MRLAIVFISAVLCCGQILAPILQKAPSAAPGATVTRTGSVATWIPNFPQATAESTTITVPEDATLAIVAVSSYYNPGDDFTTRGSVTLGAQTMLVAADGDGSADMFQGVVYYLVNPPTGSQTLSFAWENGPTQNAFFAYAFYKGIDTNAPFRGSVSVAQVPDDATVYDTGSMTAEVGDLAVGVSWSYDSYDPGAHFSTWGVTSGAASVNSQVAQTSGNSYIDLVESVPTSSPFQLNVNPPFDGGYAVMLLKHQ